MQTRTYLFILLVGFFLVGLLFFRGHQQNLYQQQFFVFGTLVEISIWGMSEQATNEAVNVIVQDFQTMHHNWHAWHPSLLTDLNQAIVAEQTWTIQDPLLLSMLKQAKQLSHQSDGLFNPAIGQLINLWGFHQDDLESSDVFSPPSSEKIAELVALAPSMNDIEIEGNRILSHNRTVQLDFGAFAKGYAVDLAIDKLRELGVQNAIINAGGNLKAIGQKGDKPWVIGIRHPSGQGVLASVTVSGEESVITSGDYERFREYEGVRYSHIIDPRNGMPVQGLTSVTVIARSGALADAASTALTVAGLSNWQRIAQQMGIQYAMLVNEAGTVYATTAMAERIQFQTKIKPKIEVSE